MRFLRWGRGDDEPLPVDTDLAERVERVLPGPLEPAEPGPHEPAESLEHVESPEPVEPGPREPAKPLEPAGPLDPVEPPEAADPAEALEPVEASGPAESAGLAEPTDGAGQAEPQGSGVPAPVAHMPDHTAPESVTPVVTPAEAELAEGDPDVATDDTPANDAESADRLVGAEAAADARVVAGAMATPEAGALAEASPTDDEPGTDDEPLSSRPSRGRVLFWPESPAEAVGDLAADDRPPALRFAALHLRGGQFALARAELEALAGRGRLDEPALLDLAEVRWRTGDLPGAGEAANALLARGSESPLALVIAAEAVAAVGRPGEARRLSSRALEVAGLPLDELFAGIPRSTIWPASPASETPGAPRRRAGTGDASRAPSTASEAFAGGRAALARGDSARAALLLSVAMRLAPEFAEDVLHAVAGRDDHPLLALVRGDALRLLGHEAEALEAFDRARGRASSAGSGSQRRVDGPGLFDDDPTMTGDEEP